jgi:hypothetical protein
VACQPSEEHLHEPDRSLDADLADDRGLDDDLRLPLSDRAPALHGDADLDAVAGDQVEPVGATTPPEVVLPVVVPVAGVVAVAGGGVAVPPLVEPVVGVELVVDEVVDELLAGVVVAGVELVEDVAEEAPVDPVVPVTPVEPVELAASSGLLSFGTSVGTVDGALSATVLPPQAARTTAPAAPPSSASDRLPRVTGSRSERTHATPARGAVVEVALGELLAPGAETQVLHRPGELRARRRERQQLADHLERLTGLAVGVDAVGIGLDDHLAPARGGAQAIAVAVAHFAQILSTGAGWHPRRGLG